MADRPAGISSTGAIARQYYNARLGGSNNGVDMHSPGGSGPISTASASANAAASSSLRDRLRRASMGGAAPAGPGTMGGFAGVNSERVIPVKDRTQFRYNFTRFATVGDCLKSDPHTPDLVGISARATAALRAAYSKNRPDLPPDMAHKEPLDGKPLLARALESARPRSHLDFDSKAGYDEPGGRRRKTLVEILRDKKERKEWLAEKNAGGDARSLTALMRDAEEERTAEEREEMVAHYRAIMAKRRMMGGARVSIDAVAKRYAVAERQATERLRLSAEERQAYYDRTGRKYVTVREQRLEELAKIEAEKQEAIRATTVRAAKHSGPGYQKGTFSTVIRETLTHSPLVEQRNQRQATMRLNRGPSSDSDSDDDADGVEDGVRAAARAMQSVRERSIIRRPIQRPAAGAAPPTARRADDEGAESSPLPPAQRHVIRRPSPSPDKSVGSSDDGDEQAGGGGGAAEVSSGDDDDLEQASPPKKLSEAEEAAAAELKLEMTSAVVDRMGRNAERTEARQAATTLLAELDAIASDDDPQSPPPQQQQQQLAAAAATPEAELEFDAEWEDVEPSAASPATPAAADAEADATAGEGNDGDDDGSDGEWNPFEGGDAAAPVAEPKQPASELASLQAEAGNSSSDEDHGDSDSDGGGDEATGPEPKPESAEDAAKRAEIVGRVAGMKPIAVRKELRELGLNALGSRQEQSERLQAHLLKEAGLPMEATAATAAGGSGGGGEEPKLGRVVFMKSEMALTADHRADLADDGCTVITREGERMRIDKWLWHQKSKRK